MATLSQTAEPALRTSDDQPRVKGSVVAAAVAGNALEFYDFTTYAFFAVYIGETFFPSHDPLMSVLLSVAVFGVGFITRPIGGIVIGAFADRVGRKPAMLLTIALITVGTLGLCLTPSYASIGVAAPIIVVCMRLIQGFALGGEVGPSSSYLIEVAPSGKRGLYGSWQLASQGLASMVAGLVGLVVIASMSRESLTAWGWRLPFLLGLALIPIALWLRQHMPESLDKEAAAPVQATPDRSAPRREGIGQHMGSVLLALMIICGGTVSTYVAIYMTTYAVTTLKLSPLFSMGATIAFGLMTWIGSLIGGWLSDRYGRKPVMLWPRVLLLLIAYPLFIHLIKAPSLWTLAYTTGAMSLLIAINSSPSLVAIPELFPSHVRALGLSIAYAFGVALFGGSAQAVVTWLIRSTGNPAAPAYYLIATSVVSVLGIVLIRETGKDVLRD